MSKTAPQRLKILLAIHSLPAGGAEKFFTTLARALAPRHEVHCYIPCLRWADLGMARRLDGIQCHSVSWFTPAIYRVFYKLRQMVIRKFPRLDLESWIYESQIRKLQKRHRFDVINTHLFMATRYACQALKDETPRVPIVETDHGHYAFLAEHQRPVAQSIFNRLDALVCPAQANSRFSEKWPWHPAFQRHLIYYGHEQVELPVDTDRRDIRLTIGMVARGVHWKGWNEALQALRLLRERTQIDFQVTWVGAGDCLDAIAASLTAEEEQWLKLIGHSDQPEQFIRHFDIALLPTYLPGESLPNSIIEYLAHEVPVIATDVGGIREMLMTSEGLAGALVAQTPEGPADVENLAQEMQKLLEDASLREQLAMRTQEAYEKFDLQKCVQHYEQLFTTLIQQRA
jgi:glycosyltransferase involved in cell wall biosynthesis